LRVKTPKNRIFKLVSLFYFRVIDISGGHYYIMTATAQLLREIETMPEETAARVLDFAKFLKGKQTLSKQVGHIE